MPIGGVILLGFFIGNVIKDLF